MISFSITIVSIIFPITLIAMIITAANKKNRDDISSVEHSIRNIYLYTILIIMLIATISCSIYALRIGLDIILPMHILIDYVNKVIKSPNFISLDTLSTGRDAFGITGKMIDSLKNNSNSSDLVEIRCAFEKIKYIPKKMVKDNIEIMNNWKVFISKANGGAGLLMDDGEVNILGKAYIGGPNSVCTDALIPVGLFKTKKEAENLQKYLSTKFVRFMVGILKASQNLTQIVYKFVPVQDFSDNSDIKWDKTVSEIDCQLYKKYGFTKEEIDFIEKKIRTMD